MKYASIDLETTGLDYNRDQILEVGIVIDDLSWPDVVKEGPYGGRPYVRLLVWHDVIHGQAAALAMNKDLLEEIAEAEERGVGFNTAETDSFLRDFLRQHFPGGLVTAAGKNVASFDLPFLKNNMPLSFELFHHRSVDPAMLYWQPGDTCPSLSQCLERAGLPSEVSHRACEDAYQIIQLIRFKLR